MPVTESSAINPVSFVSKNEKRNDATIVSCDLARCVPSKHSDEAFGQVLLEEIEPSTGWSS